MNLETAVLWLWRCMIVFSILSLVQAQSQPSKPKADLILFHGNIYTGVISLTAFDVPQRAQALAVLGDRIQAVGSNTEILALKGPHTQVIDLHGHFVMPGFNDAHMHMVQAGMQKLELDLTGVKSLAEFRQRIREYAANLAPDEWIIGAGWDETLWPSRQPPSRWDIDEVAPHNPVFLRRIDGHIAVVNGEALQFSRISEYTPDPPGGEIDRDASGAPTGILRETAQDLVSTVIPKPSHAKRRKAIEFALQDLAQWGITSAQDNSDAGDPELSWDDFQIFEELEREGKLTARISEWLDFDDPIDVLEAHRASHPTSDTMLHTGMLKAFMDGSLGSHTAALLQPYTDQPQNSGLPRYEQAALNQMAEIRLDAGFQLGFHAIGDKGVQMALDAFAAAEKEAHAKHTKALDGSENYRLRIEHAQVTNSAQVAEFHQLQVIASMQPNHLLTDMHWALSRLGPDRAAYSYAWAEFLNNGVTLAFGTDYPVEPVNPFRGLYAAITRQSEDGSQEYFPEQKLTMEQAISAYTTGSAFAEFAEKDKGTLAAGKLADFVVLDRDITAIPPRGILATKVLRTVVGGKTVYSAN
jgi:predicted amidohydrolase YtcJ